MTEALPAPPPRNQLTCLADVLISMARQYDMPHPETVETVVAGLLADRQRAVCLCHDERCRVLEDEERQQVLDTFLTVWREAESVRSRGPHIYIARNEVDAVCRAAGWEMPSMFPMRFGNESRDRPLDATTRTCILQATGLEAGADAAEHLLLAIEKAVNRYRREPAFEERLPNKPKARTAAAALVHHSDRLRYALHNMHPDLHMRFRWLLEEEWNVDLDKFEGMLQQFENGARELKVQIEERMRDAGRKPDKAAKVLAREVAHAMHEAGAKPSAYAAGPFEAHILPAALKAAGAGSEPRRVHELAMQAVRALKKYLEQKDGTEPRVDHAYGVDPAAH